MIPLAGLREVCITFFKYGKKNNTDDEFYLFSFKPICFDISDYPDNWHLIIKEAPINTGAVWSRMILPGLLINNGIQAYWGTNYTLPPKLSSIRMVLTIYDLAIMHFKGIGKVKTELSLKLFGKANCIKADSIIAISMATKEDITRIWNISPDKIIVSYCGGPQKIDKDVVLASSSKNNEHVIPELGEYFLFIGTIEPRKNIVSIIRAFEEFCDNTCKNMKLVLCGKRGWYCESVYEAIEHSKYKSKIVVLGYINDSTKEQLLKNAKAFVYPSLYEGFGIPILEAMEYNLPVITCRVSSLPEVAGDAAFYIDNPKDIKQLANIMNDVLELDQQGRDLLINRMNKQRSKFSWEKNASEILDVIHGETVK